MQDKQTTRATLGCAIAVILRRTALMHTPDGSGKQEVSTHLFFLFVGCQESRATEGTSARLGVRIRGCHLLFKFLELAHIK